MVNNQFSQIEDFEQLTLSSQLEYLTEALETLPAVDLIRLCGPIRDPAPLAWLSKQLLERGWFQTTDHQEWFADFLVSLPETAVDKLLKAMVAVPQTETDSEGRERRQSLCQLLLRALSVVPLTALSSMCLIDRTMKHHFPEQRDAHLTRVFQKIETQIKAGQPETIPLASLAQMTSTAISSLENSAISTSQACLETFQAHRKRLAREAIQILEDAPKAVSQANAEDLLARRVYTDPGHFLIELLQNAEDSGAKIWRVICDRDKLVIWHDGIPFDTRDLVGITSIGQTTKRKQQIGFFGVGFKSVYEVTDRPQIYSDVYNFEIADVSIPKLLAQRPSYLPPGGTAVVLPLRANLDNERSPGALFEKGASLDSCVLLTLRSIEEIEFKLTEAAGGPYQHKLIECAGESGTTIRHEPSGNIVAYQIQDDEFLYSGVAREPGRPDSTKVMVGLLLDEAGHPTPLPSSAAEVYSYLPTREQPGLRFFIQGHFDVPVDRERIAPDSLWNRWIVSQVPLQLGRLAERIGMDENFGAAAGFIDVLPLKRDLQNAPFAQIPTTLSDVLNQIAFVPVIAENNSLKFVAPIQTTVANAAIISLFEHDQIGNQRFFVAKELSERHREILLELGSESFTIASLVSYLEQRLSNQSSGAVPNFMHATEKLELLYDLLLSEIEVNDRKSDKTDLNDLIERLRALPLVLDASGNLRTADKVVRGSPVIRKIYADSRHFIAESFEGANARTHAFLDRLGVEELDLEYLVCDLENRLGNEIGPLEFPRASFPTNQTCLNTILEAFVSADWNILQRVAELPLFRSRDGKFYPMAKSPADDQGVLNASNPTVRDIALFYGSARPIADSETDEWSAAKEKSAYQILLDRLPIPSLTLSVLCDDLQRSLFKTDLDNLKQLHELLEKHVDDISDKVSKQLVQLQIWPDRNSNARPLRGPNRVFIPADEAICEIFPHAPFLNKDIAERRHTINISIPSVTVNQVIEALTADSEPPLQVESDREHVDRALAYVLANTRNVDSSGIRTLKEKASFVSDTGKVLPLNRLSKSESAELRSIYADSDIRHFIDESGSSWALVTELGLESSLTSANVEVLADDLQADFETDGKLRNPETGYRAILSYTSKRVDKMTRPLILRYTEFPIFPDTKGDTGSLTSVKGARSPKFVYPASGQLRNVLALTNVRLLNAEIENIVRPLIIAAKIPDAGLDLLVDSLAEQPVTDESTLDAIQELFVNRKFELQELFAKGERTTRANKTLNTLPIWKTLNGEVKSAQEIMGGNLSELFAPDTAEYGDLLKACVKPAALNRLKDLSPLMVPIEPENFLADLIKRTAKSGHPLTAQPYFLSTIERVLRLYEVVGNRQKVELPSVDAANNLTFTRLSYTDSETLLLLSGLPVLEQILHPELTTYFQLNKEEPNRFGLLRNQVAKLWTKVMSTRGFDEFEKLTPDLVIAALPPDSDAARRSKFYRWLINNKLSVFDDKKNIAKLLETPLFETKNGRLVKPVELVFDDDIPDLGIDWLPGPSIPTILLDTMKIHLDVGRLNLDDLIRRHVVPAYEAATNSSDHLQAGKILSWLAKRLINRSESEIKRLLKGKNSECIKLESTDGNFYLPQELLLPAIAIRPFVSALWEDVPQPSELRYSEDVYPFLVSLGVSTTPNLELIATKLEAIKSRDESIALAHVVYHTRENHGEGIYKRLPTLRTAPWLADGDGVLKSPSKLYVRSYEIESLVGPYADLYIDKAEETILGQSLIRGLGFKEIDGVTTTEIFNHLEHRASRKEAISQRVYSWLDLAASKGQLTIELVETKFGDKPWILTDDGEYESHKRVIGTRAFHLFGNLRGYWTRGWKQYPALCHLLGITEGTTPKSVKSFVEEIGRDVAKNGSKELIKQEPALPLMLVSCFAVLSKKGMTISRDLPVVPAVHKQQTELIAASAPGIYWSDTPTLETLFANVGKLYLARRGTADDADYVDAFYISMGINRLRDTYKVVASKREGSDRSASSQQEIVALRQVLRALVSIMPRIQLERELNADSTWVFAKHLRTLSASGSIKAIENLKVRYVLNGVGETEVDRPAAYDTERGELLVDTKVLTDPELTGLSEGLLPAIIEGPSAETFIDLFEILLARRTAENMSAYLNRRHFAEAHIAPTAIDRIAQRIGELLDYGLTEKLSKRFSVFDGRSPEKWREPSLIKEIEGLVSTDANQTAAEAVKLMLKTVGIDSDEKELAELLKKLLLASSISECSELLVDKSIIKIDDNDKLAMVSRKDETPKDEVMPPKPKAEDESRSAPKNKTEIDNAHLFKLREKLDPLKEFSNFFGQVFRGNQSDSLRPKDPTKIQEEKTDTEKSANKNGSSGEKSNQIQEEKELPSWLLGNYFRSSKSIPSQMWCNSQGRQKIESMKKEAFLHFSPGRLPAPYLYAVNTVGVNFNPVLQSWTSGGSVQKFFLTPGDTGDRTVSFSGQLYAGRSRLPLPLYSRLAGPVTVSNGTLKSVTHDEIGVFVELGGEGLISINYDVAIQTVPQLSQKRTPLSPPDRALITPTVARHTLPNRVNDWINEMNSVESTAQKKAIAAQDFIRSNYQYDGGFLERDEVIKKRGNLSFLSGNHHLELLHASGDDEILGRGVCYELNVMLVELLRHLKIPSFIAIGWVMDEGVVDLSDHLFALALVNSEDGPCLLPLDAAATDRGPIRTVQRRSFPTPAKDLKARPTIPTVKGTWNITPKNSTAERSTALDSDRYSSSPYEGEPSQRPKPSSSSHTPEIPKANFSFKDWFLNGKDKEEPKPSSNQKTISKSLSDARLAQEYKIRKQLEATIAKEREMRIKAEERLGEERRLRKQAEMSMGKSAESAQQSEDDVSALASSEELLDFRVTEPRRQANEYSLLCNAYDRVIDALGLEAAAYPMGSEGLRQKLIKLLGGTATVEVFLKILQGELTGASFVSKELKSLEDLRLIEIETVPTLKLSLIDSNDDEV